ncbi:MAG: hypothetical protein WB542_17005 [Polaromonas sp.]
MGAVVIEEHWAGFIFSASKIPSPLTTHHADVQRYSCVGDPSLRERQQLGKPLRQNPMKLDACFPRRALVLIACSQGVSAYPGE